jgi:pimeloyl-ACP methyl ester carboxylesterase
VSTFEQLDQLAKADPDVSFSPLERDAALFKREWGQSQLPPVWNRCTTSDDDQIPYYERQVWTVTNDEAESILKPFKKNKRPGTDVVELHDSVVLRERLLPFPSAPIHILMNREDRGPERVPIGFHSMRVLDLPDRDVSTTADRVYLLHHGLNELPGMAFYYQLAGWLIANDPNSVCIVRPFPGHLTRFPTNPRWAETPLDRYLNRSSELFRHFLRYMVETQWLLSCLAPRSRYDTLSGVRLLGTLIDPANPNASRSDAWSLATEMCQEHSKLRDWQTSANELSEGKVNLPGSLDESKAHASIALVRYAVGWKSDHLPKAPQNGPGMEERPTVHTVGYSLGGFVAQSIFMSWPFLVASCTTICAGGALHELAPIDFAHEEEWRTLMHSLRYWLDRAMVSGTFTEENERILGMRSSFIDYLIRIFYEIFEQEFRPSYQTRVSEYLQRLLFVVGGNDPIVKPQSVLDAMPPEGANIISIAELSHFLASERRATGDIEREQRKFWLPEIARIITRFAKEAERTYRRTLATCWRKADNSGYQVSLGPHKSEDQVSERDLFKVGTDGSLPAPLFEKFLDSMIYRTRGRGGFLFIFRNDVPTWMLSTEYQIYRAKALHHSEDRLRLYLDGLAWRQETLGEIGKGVIVFLPKDALQRLERGYLSGHAPPAAEAPMGEFMLAPGKVPSSLAVDATAQFRADWIIGRSLQAPQVRVFDPGTITFRNRKIRGASDIRTAGKDGVIQTLAALGREEFMVSRLPDLWMFLSPGDVIEVSYSNPELKLTDPKVDLRATAVEQMIARVTRKFVDKPWEETTRLSPGSPRESKAPSDPTRWRSTDQIRAIAVSRAPNNPRYRGKVITGERELQKALVHASLAALRSKEAPPGKFVK